MKIPPLHALRALFSHCRTHSVCCEYSQCTRWQWRLAITSTPSHTVHSATLPAISTGYTRARKTQSNDLTSSHACISVVDAKIELGKYRNAKTFNNQTTPKSSRLIILTLVYPVLPPSSIFHAANCALVVERRSQGTAVHKRTIVRRDGCTDFLCIVTRVLLLSVDCAGTCCSRGYGTMVMQARTWGAGNTSTVRARG